MQHTELTVKPAPGNEDWLVVDTTHSINLMDFFAEDGQHREWHRFTEYNKDKAWVATTPVTPELLVAGYLTKNDRAHVGVFDLAKKKHLGDLKFADKSPKIGATHYSGMDDPIMMGIIPLNDLKHFAVIYLNNNSRAALKTFNNQTLKCVNTLELCDWRELAPSWYLTLAATHDSIVFASRTGLMRQNCFSSSVKLETLHDTPDNRISRTSITRFASLGNISDNTIVSLLSKSMASAIHSQISLSFYPTQFQDESKKEAATCKLNDEPFVPNLAVSPNGQHLCVYTGATARLLKVDKAEGENAASYSVTALSNYEFEKDREFRFIDQIAWCGDHYALAVLYKVECFDKKDPRELHLLELETKQDNHSSFRSLGCLDTFSTPIVILSCGYQLIAMSTCFSLQYRMSVDSNSHLLTSEPTQEIAKLAAEFHKHLNQTIPLGVCRIIAEGAYRPMIFYKPTQRVAGTEPVNQLEKRLVRAPAGSS